MSLTNFKLRSLKDKLNEQEAEEIKKRAEKSKEETKEEDKGRASSAKRTKKQ